ncbi:MAG: response regulator [Pirellulaceae bacterium]
MPSILVVDDTSVDRRLAGGLLEKSPELDIYYAENGRDALLMIGNYLPDLVVTDMQMPEMDGLELVNQIVERFPDLPVVLMTAHGSENVAAQALANGAASFVPKSELAGALLETVNQVLSIAASETRHRRLNASLKRTQFEFELENDPQLIPPLLDLLQQFLVNLEGYDHPTRVRMGVALEQALLNAMLRGNLELSRELVPATCGPEFSERKADTRFSERRVQLTINIGQDEVEFTIRDDGPGFDLALVPSVGAAESFVDGTGRGLVLIRNFMDEVHFSDGGRTLRMTKARPDGPSKPR